jgi:hypothetical protein
MLLAGLLLLQEGFPAEPPPSWTEEAFKAFALGILGVLAVYLAGFAILGVLSLLSSLLGAGSVTRSFKIYQGYGAVLFSLIPQALLVFLFVIGGVQAVAAFDLSANPQKVFIDIFNQRAEPRTIDWPGGILQVFLPHYSQKLEPSHAVRLVEGMMPVILQILMCAVFALPGASVLGILSIFGGHFRRLMALPMARTVKTKEYAAPIVSMMMYVPSGGLLLMMALGGLWVFTNGFTFLMADQYLVQARILADTPSASPFEVSLYLFGFLAFALEVVFLFAVLMSMFALVFSLSLRRTFDSWLSTWYATGDRLIDRPPPFVLYLRTSGRAAAKLLSITAMCYGATRVFIGVCNLTSGTLMILFMEILVLNMALFWIGLHREFYRLFAALTDVWSLHRLYVWTTRTLVVPADRSLSK